MGIDISPMPMRHGQTPARRLHLPESEPLWRAPDAASSSAHWLVFENSPAIYGWVHGSGRFIVPSGTKENCLPSLTGLCNLDCVVPSHKWLGYCRRPKYIETIMHSFNSCLMHCVFSTSERHPWLTPAIRERL
jgi:hypothetical protein